MQPSRYKVNKVNGTGLQKSPVGCTPRIRALAVLYTKALPNFRQKLTKLPQITQGTAECDFLVFMHRTLSQNQDIHNGYKVNNFSSIIIRI